MNEKEEIQVAAFYKFVKLVDLSALKSNLLACCVAHEVKGTILLAAEGINGTIAGTRTAISAVLSLLRADPRFVDLEEKESYTDALPFYRMKVRLKKEIVTLGAPGVEPNEQVGTYVHPEDWNDLISRPDVILVDTRNSYEVAIGTFAGALNPNIARFRQFPTYVRQRLSGEKRKKIAMFCTGGIRCEKATSFLLGQGFETVYHLKGGILKYLETVPQEQSRWRGECFVFDNRVAVGHGLRAGTYALCRGCRHPVSKQDTSSPQYREGVCCPNCFGTLSPAQRASREERQKQVTLSRGRNEQHIGVSVKR